MFNRKYIFTGSIFHCYVGLPECSFFNLLEATNLFCVMLCYCSVKNAGTPCLVTLRLPFTLSELHTLFLLTIDRYTDIL